jgi:hypothetical protein
MRMDLPARRPSTFCSGLDTYIYPSNKSPGNSNVPVVCLALASLVHFLGLDSPAALRLLAASLALLCALLLVLACPTSGRRAALLFLLNPLCWMSVLAGSYGLWETATALAFFFCIQRGW